MTQAKKKQKKQLQYYACYLSLTVTICNSYYRVQYGIYFLSSDFLYKYSILYDVLKDITILLLE